MSDPITPLDPQQEEKVGEYAIREGYGYRLLVGLDMFANVITGGYLGETISSRSARADKAGKWWGRTMSGFLNWFEYDHGAKAMAADKERAEVVTALEKQ